MTNAMDRTSKKTSRSGSTVSKIFALLLVICLVECATEQRINSRGSKTSNLIEKANGWRSQRGGSCLSYGHSCWGAHGKRSGKPPGSDPGLWYLARILGRMAANDEMNHEKLLTPKNDGMDSIYNVPDELTDAKPSLNEDRPIELPQNGKIDGKPMLDDDTLSNIKLWQIMRGASAEN